jgi:hypothetical protein
LNRLVPEPPFTGKKTQWGKRKLARDRKARQRRRCQMTDELWIKRVTAWEKFEDDAELWGSRCAFGSQHGPLTVSSPEAATLSPGLRITVHLFWSRRRSQSGGGFRISFCCLIHSCASSSLAKYVRVETEFGRVTLT